MSALEQLAYELIEARVTEDFDEAEECEWLAHPVPIREQYLRHQARLLSELWQMLADSFSPDTIADFLTALEPDQ
jgi:hypothetical protein